MKVYCAFYLKSFIIQLWNILNKQITILTWIVIGMSDRYVTQSHQSDHFYDSLYGLIYKNKYW